MKRIALIFAFLIVFSYQATVFSQYDKDRKVKVLIEEQNTFEMNVVNNKLILKNAPVGKHVEVVSIIGIKVREIKITTPVLEKELNLPQGLYILRMEEKVKKTFIK